MELSRASRDMWPAVGEPEGKETIEGLLEPVESFLATLDRNSVAVAGFEQIVLATFNSTVPDAIAMSAALHQMQAIFPENWHAAVSDLVSYLHSAQFHTDMHAAIHQSVLDAAHHLLPWVDHAGMVHDGLIVNLSLALGAHDAAAAEAVKTAMSEVGKWAASTLPDGVNIFAHLAHHSVLVGDAIQHFGTAASSAGDVLAVDHVLGHVPWITVAISGVREIRLLSDGKTEIENSLKNFALDVAGGGAGGLAGLKTGAAIGFAVGGPHGAAVGAIIGAIAGAMTGRAITNEIKRAPFDRALADLKAKSIAYPDRMLSAAGQLAGTVALRADEGRERYLATMEPAPSLSRKSPETLEDLADRLSVTTRSYTAELQALLTQADGAPWWLGYQPAETPRLRTAVTAAANALARCQTLPDERSRLMDLALLAEAGLPAAPALGVGARYGEACLQVGEVMRGEILAHRQDVRGWAQDVSSEFAECMGDLRPEIEAALTKFDGDRSALVAEIEAAELKCKREAERLGKG